MKNTRPIPMQWIDPPTWAIKRHPKGTTFKKNPDGTITLILPDKTKQQKKEHAMEQIDMICIEANMQPWKGKQWYDPEKKMRFLEYRGHVFYLTNSEIWKPWKGA